MKTIQTSNAPAANRSVFSQAKVMQPVLYLHQGQIPLNPATGEVEGTTIEAQAERVMKNVRSDSERGRVGF